MARRGGRGLAAKGKEAGPGKSGLFLAAVSLLTLDNPVPQFTPAQQPACSGGGGGEGGQPLLGEGAGGAKSPPNPQPGEGDESLLHFSLPSRATLAGKGKRCPHPPEPPQALPREERRNPNAEKSLPIPDQGGHSASRSPASQDPHPLAFSQREFPTPGQRLSRTGSAASRTSPAAAAALGEVTANPAERLRREDAPGAPGSPRQRGMKESPAPRRSGKR